MEDYTVSKLTFFNETKNGLTMTKMCFFFWFVFVCVQCFAQQSDFTGISFTKADERARQHQGENLESLPKLAYELTHDLPTDVEKFRAIYKWVCANVENDYLLYLESKRNRIKMQKDSLKLSLWNKEFTKKVFQRLRKDHKTVCTGYAYLIKELLHQVDIKAVIIDGYGRTANDNVNVLSMVNHSWNAVQIQNKWYLCDATWASGVYNLNDYRFEFNYNDGYFLTDPDLFAKSHYPLNPEWLLTTKNVQIPDFLQGPIVYGDTFKEYLNPIEPKTMHLDIKKGEEVTFLLKETVPNTLDNLGVEIGSETIKSVKKPDFKYTKEGLIELKQVFNDTGFYEVHLKTGTKYLATYTVKVIRNKLRKD